MSLASPWNLREAGLRSGALVIAFDVMGGDFGSRPCVLAALKFACQYTEAVVVLFGRHEDLARELSKHKVPENIVVYNASDVVSMHDDPAYALRHKRDSSMWKALESLADGRVQACVSAGNTGALMAISRHVVKLLPGIQRPAICKSIPTQNGSSLLLDLGANVNCSSQNLYQFACMGVALARVNGLACPRVALLNVGTEMTKGSDEVRGAAQLLRDREGSQCFEFTGFIEGDHLYSGDVDVIVCDGFSGNVALKVSEGLVKQFIDSLNDFFSSSLYGRFCRLFLGPILKRWSRDKNPSLYNGAVFLGLRKAVIKSHGGADDIGLFNALETAYCYAKANIPSKVAISLDLEA